MNTIVFTFIYKCACVCILFKVKRKSRLVWLVQLFSLLTIKCIHLDNSYLLNVCHEAGAVLSSSD